MKKWPKISRIQNKFERTFLNNIFVTKNVFMPTKWKSDEISHFEVKNFIFFFAFLLLLIFKPSENTLKLSISHKFFSRDQKYPTDVPKKVSGAKQKIDGVQHVLSFAFIYSTLVAKNIFRWKRNTGMLWFNKEQSSYSGKKMVAVLATDCSNKSDIW